MSNIRRRNQGKEEKDTYLEEPFMQRDRNHVFRDREDDEDEVEYPTENLTGDPMYDFYRIKPGTPIEEQIEILLLTYDKSVSEIQLLLKLTYDDANRRVTELEERLRNVGRQLEGEDKELARGKAIRRLQSSIADIERELARNKDPRLLTARLQAQKELNALMELATDKKAKDGGVEVEDTFDTAIGKLGQDRVLELHARLKAQSSSSDVPSS